MARIAFLLMAHKAPRRVVAQARALASAGHYVAVHFDKAAPKKDFLVLQRGLKNRPNIVLLRRRVRCGWGEWSLVGAALKLVRQALSRFPDASHFYLISGDCVPICPSVALSDDLDRNDTDIIETHDFFRSDWIKTGLKEERLIYRHWANERTQTARFYLGLRLQQLFGLSRRIPKGIRPRIGSQWWCLRRSTVEAILRFSRARRDVVRFFRTTWIPDETFFQTLVAHLVPQSEIQNRCPTFLRFSDYGMPVSYYSGQTGYLLGREKYFARKVAASAVSLRSDMFAVWKGQAKEFTGEPDLHGFMASRGRRGQRSPKAPWITTRTDLCDIGVVVCKAWDTGTYLASRADAFGVTLGYVFDEAGKGLPDLGGLEDQKSVLETAPDILLKMVARQVHVDSLLFCLDPSRVKVLHALAKTHRSLRLLNVHTALSPGFLVGHASRLGHWSDDASVEVKAQVMSALRHELEDEMQAIQSFTAGHRVELTDIDDPKQVDAALAEFLDIPSVKARHRSPKLTLLEG